MALNFPNGAVANDVYTIDGYSWVFDGTKWKAIESKQPLDSNIFSVFNGPRLANSFLTTDGNSIYWSGVNLTTNAQTGTSYALALADQNYLIEMNNALSNTVNIPLNSSIPFPIGTQITVLQTGAGQTTITTDVGVTLNCTPQSTSNVATLRAQWSSVQLIKRATNTWVAIGDLV